MRYVEADPLPEGTGDRVSRMNPAEGVEDVLGDVLGVDAIDGIAHILLGRNDQREGKHARCRDRVVQPEYPRVDVNVGHPQQATQLTKYLDHDAACLASTSCKAAPLTAILQLILVAISRS